MSCARSRTKASPWLPAICWRVIVFVIGENRSFVWIVPDLFFQSQSTDKEVGLSPESVSLACLPRRPLAGPRAPVPSSCTWSFRLRSSARSSSPTDWERYVNPASLRVRKNPPTKNSVSALSPFWLTKYHRADQPLSFVTAGPLGCLTCQATSQL